MLQDLLMLVPFSAWLDQVPLRDAPLSLGCPLKGQSVAQIFYSLSTFGPDSEFLGIVIIRWQIALVFLFV